MIFNPWVAPVYKISLQSSPPTLTLLAVSSPGFIVIMSLKNNSISIIAWLIGESFTGIQSTGEEVGKNESNSTHVEITGKRT